MLMITALSGMISGECLFYKKMEDIKMKTFGRNSSLQEREKRTLNRLLAYQKEAEKIIRKQPSRHMIRKG